MSDETTATEAPPEGTDDGQQEQETFTREYVESLRKENAKYRTKAGEQAAAAKAAEKARLDSLTEAERQIEEAKAVARSEAVTEFGKRLARTEFDAIAGRRNPDFDTVSALEWVDLARFVGDDGEPDTDAIKAAVERLVPAPAEGSSPGPRPDLSQGAKPGDVALNGDPLLNDLKSKLGIS